ncbi:PIN domain-containing protein [Streptomyces phaeochromogenes]|uniref:PIN domain-containing protein n=1 Tax=Streptomyces phaeochromogenes TaxID=1923 RepID=UPI00386B47CB|nr:PIN domain-containing protein [Streptomyces phaeochromogenes]
MIVFDSNQMRLFLPGSSALQQFVAVAERAGHTIATTDLVVREVVRQHRARLLSAAKALADSQRDYNELVTSPGGRTKVSFADSRARRFFANREIMAFQSAINEAYRVLPTLAEDTLTAVQWEADHRRPCHDGAGARDAAIWLTAARACETPDLDESRQPLPVIFVSNDNDFSAPGDKSSLAEELRSEHTESGRMVLKKGAVDVLAELGYPKRRVDAQAITARADFQKALLDVAMGEDGLPSRHLTQLEAAEIMIHLRKDGEAYECRGDDLALTSISGTWGVRVVLERLPRRPDGRGGGVRLLPGVPREIEATALLIEDHERQSAAIEILPVAMW